MSDALMHIGNKLILGSVQGAYLAVLLWHLNLIRYVPPANLAKLINGPTKPTLDTSPPNILRQEIVPALMAWRLAARAG
jgi:hypothetical protein